LTDVHLANTDFEFELSNANQALSLEHSWERHPICLQLQFLPLLYSLPNDYVAVSNLPDSSYLENLQSLLNSSLPALISLKEKDLFHKQNCVPWGPSLKVQAWALQREMQYSMPDDWPIIQQVNSKAFSLNFTLLKESALIDNLGALNDWLNSFKGIKVLKTCFGLSGLGHLIIDSQTSGQKITAFCLKEWQSRRPILGEPWLDRLFDFSTQWFLSKEGSTELLGATVFESNAKGGYEGTLAGPEQEIFQTYLPYLQEHMIHAKRVLSRIFEMGYFGHVGIDAFVYRCPQTKELRLYPVVEINGRKTLSYVALRLQQLKFPDRIIRFSFKNNAEGCISLLPDRLITDRGKTYHFRRKLVIEEIVP
jgi:hypothetical protein